MRQFKFLCLAIVIALPGASLHAEPSATQPATQPADTPQVKELRDQLLAWDTDTPTMSLEDFRKTFHTENEREAVYCDFLATDDLETLKTEKAIRDKWGPDADAQFAHLTGYSTLEDDRVCKISVDGNHADVSWDLKGMQPEKFIKIDGHWLADNHAMFDGWLKDDPTMETNKNPTGKLMRQARTDISAGKFADADSFMADFKAKWGPAPDGN